MSTAQSTQESPSKVYAKQLLRTLVAVKKGDFSVRMPIDGIGLGGKIADALNDVIELNQRMAAELDRIGTVVGKEGKLLSGRRSATLKVPGQLASILSIP